MFAACVLEAAGAMVAGLVVVVAPNLAALLSRHLGLLVCTPTPSYATAF